MKISQSGVTSIPFKFAPWVAKYYFKLTLARFDVLLEHPLPFALILMQTYAAAVSLKIKIFRCAGEFGLQFER
jgi:hypothetical protein